MYRFFVFIFISFALRAQTPQPEYSSQEIKRPVPPAYIRSADAAWVKSIWRQIDLREKFNQPLYYPYFNDGSSKSLFDILRQKVLKGEVAAYNANDDELISKLNTEQLSSRLIKKDTLTEINIDERGNEMITKTPINDTVGGESILRYLVKEDLVFDSKRSVIEIRILAICPVKYDPDRDLYIPLFWVYYPQCRDILANAYSFNSGNDQCLLSFDNIFMKHKFHSEIYKESNVYDRPLSSYLVGMDLLNESDLIKNKLRDFENDLWEY